MKFHLLPGLESGLNLQGLLPCPAPEHFSPLPFNPRLRPIPSRASPQREFFSEMLPHALAAQRLTGMPASVSLAQAALESGWGQHAPGNNFFGIKGTGPAGSQRLMTHEYRRGRSVRVAARFRRYHDAQESFLDHARVIAEGRYLRHAMRHRGDASAFVHALQSGPRRYATDPAYEAKILQLIHRYRLERYDRPAP